MGWSDTHPRVTSDLVSRLAYFEYRQLIALSLSLSLVTVACGSQHGIVIPLPIPHLIV